MTLRAGELAAVCAELSSSIVGRPVHKVVQPDDDTILLQLREKWLLVCVSPTAGRLHLVEKPAGSGEAAPAFCMLLRKHLVGARVASLQAVDGERAAMMELTSADDTPVLRLYLFGMASQLQLVARDEDGETRVLGAIGRARKLYDELPPPRPPRDEQMRFSSPLSPAIDRHYAAIEDVDALTVARRAAKQRLEQQRKKLARLAAALQNDLGRTDAAELQKKAGDLLLAHLHLVEKGASTVTVPDVFTDGGPFSIALDPARSANDNAQRFYKEHKRLGRARGALERRIGEVAAQLSELEAKLAAVDELPPEALRTDERDAPTRRRQDARALPYRRYTSATGVPILVGRGDKRNDELTWKVARGNDLWLHSRDVPGAHVVVPLEGGRDVDQETLVDAATLAAHHSNARGEAQVDVGYALRKHLRKPKKSAPGAVLVSNQKTIRVRMESARLQRLVKTRQE